MLIDKFYCSPLVYVDFKHIKTQLIFTIKFQMISKICSNKIININEIQIIKPRLLIKKKDFCILRFNESKNNQWNYKPN